jgi:hypothetical protein
LRSCHKICIRNYSIMPQTEVATISTMSARLICGLRGVDAGLRWRGHPKCGWIARKS